MESRSTNIGFLPLTRQNGVSVLRNVLRLQFGAWLGLDSSYVARFWQQRANFCEITFPKRSTKESPHSQLGKVQNRERSNVGHKRVI